MSRNTDDGFSVRKRQRHDQPVWVLVGSDAQPVEQAERFIHTLVLRGLSPRTRRTYAYDLLEAYRWMAAGDRQPELLPRRCVRGRDIRHLRARAAIDPQRAGPTILAYLLK